MGVQKSKVSKLKKRLKKTFKFIKLNLKLNTKNKYYFFLKKEF